MASDAEECARVLSQSERLSRLSGFIYYDLTSSSSSSFSFSLKLIYELINNYYIVLDFGGGGGGAVVIREFTLLSSSLLIDHN